VLIDLPRDVALAPCPRLLAVPQEPEGYRSPYQPDPYHLQQALNLLQAAQRPVILAGGGVIHAGAAAELRRLAEALSAPVATTLMGLGAFPSRHPLSLGMPGMHGTAYANLALHHSDLILVVGCRLDDRVTGKVESFAPQARIVHIDVDASEIGKILPAAVPLEADAKPALKALVQGVSAWESRPDHGPWLEQIRAWQRQYPMTYREREGIIAPQRVVEELGRLLAAEDDAILVTGVGQHQMFAAQFFPFSRPRSFITSGGLGTMGFGLPAAIGAQMGRPQARVVCLDGDGSFLMTIQELATAVRYRVPVVSVILNNSYLGMVRQWQEMFFDRRLSQVELAPPPYHQVARAFGGLGRRVERPEELEAGLAWALSESRRRRLPAVLEVLVDPEALVLPMVPPGGANVEFIPCPGQED
jgi:acetolactate synthase-1/2/3 large subunit